MPTSYAEGQFGKPFCSIEKDDLIKYFSTERDESLTLEFKSFTQKEGDIKHKENGVLKAICAFLNSNGGLVIWGAPQGLNNSVGQKVFTGALSPVEKRYSKDDFISKVSNRIVPYSRFVRFHSVEIEDNKFVYLIEVDESETKPHQLDNIYYARLDGQTKAAPHYLIDALFKQIRLPVINGYLRIDKLKIGQLLDNNLDYTRLTISLHAAIFNKSVNINDKGVYIILSSNFGKIGVIGEDGTYIGLGEAQVSNCRFSDKYTRLQITDPDKLLTFGIGTTYRIEWEASYGDYKNILLQNEGIVFSMLFGSHSSNMRMSTYTVTLTDRFYANSGGVQTYQTVGSIRTYITVDKQENHNIKDLNNPTSNTDLLEGV